jgi:hypothetical protein
MNLADELKRPFVQVVLDTIGDPAQPQVVRSLVGHQAMSSTRPGMNGFQYAEWIVAHSLRQPNRYTFVRVVTRTDPAGSLPELHELVEDLVAGRVEWEALQLALWVPVGWPFLDREALRQTLQDMAEGSGPPALAIEGGTGEGKRTMASYIGHLADSTDSFLPIFRELRSEPGNRVLFAMAMDLYMAFPSQLDLSTTHQEPERQARAYAREIAVAVPNAPTPVWFVASVIGQPTVGDGLLPFVDELLRLVKATPEIARNLRMLVLCDQLGRLPLEHAPPASARHALPQITDVEIRQWFEAVAPGKSPTLYQLTVERVLQSLEQQSVTPADRLRMLAVQCKRAHATL